MLGPPPKKRQEKEMLLKKLGRDGKHLKELHNINDKYRNLIDKQLRSLEEKHLNKYNSKY
jgi:hypothetical protein